MNINDFMVKPQNTEKLKEDYYGLFGSHDYLDENKNPRVNQAGSNMLAKTVYYEHRAKHFIKIGDHGKIYNPIGLYSEGTSDKFLSKIGKKAWEFKEVSPVVFDLYVKFLKTKNIAWLRNAEREME